MKRSYWTKLALLVGLGSLPLIAACSSEPSGDTEEESLVESGLGTGAPELRGSIEVTRPAALELATIDGHTSLLIASAGLAGAPTPRAFGPPARYGSADAVRMITGIDALFESATTLESANVITAARSTAENGYALTWPNAVIQAPEGAFLHRGLIAAGGAQIAAPDKTGRVSFVDLQTGAIAHLTKEKAGWIYQRVVARDMNGDGLVDLLTARQAPADTAAAPGGITGEILWLENPGAAVAAKGPWKEHVLAAASEGDFQLADLDGDGSDEILAAAPSRERLDIFWLDAFDAGKLARDADGHALSSSIEGVRADEVVAVDLNLDGRLDLLAMEASPAGDRVLAFEVPADFKADPAARFVAHTLFEGAPGPVKEAASAGHAVPFQRSADDEGKPRLLVTGGAGGALVLEPRVATRAPSAASDWAYEVTWSMRSGHFGRPVVADVDGDGFCEAFFPDRGRDLVSVWTFAHEE